MIPPRTNRIPRVRNGGWGVFPTPFLHALGPTLLLLLCAGIRVHAAGISIKGSDTMVVLSQKWAERYGRLHPGTMFQVTGGGSGTGFAALQNRQTDLAQASRPIRPAEIEKCIRAFRKQPMECPVALDSITIYVHPSNPIQSLSLGELRDIFTGRVTRWKQVGGRDAPIILYSRENSSGTYEFFKEKVLLGSDFSPRTQTLAGTAQVVQQVGLDPNGIGYGGNAFGLTARHVPISVERGSDAVEPDEAEVIARRYPIWRYLYLYLNPDNADGEIGSFLNWVRGPGGQAVARDAGFFPLIETPRSAGLGKPPAWAASFSELSIGAHATPP